MVSHKHLRVDDVNLVNVRASTSTRTWSDDGTCSLSSHHHFLRDLEILVANVSSSLNHSLAWSSLFAVSPSKIICLNASTGATLSQRSIHDDNYNRIAPTSDGALVLTSTRQRNHTTTTKSRRPRTDCLCPRAEALM